MRSIALPALTLLFAVSSAPAFAINSCRTDHLTCATTMPIGGYCECTVRGDTEGGTVNDAPARGGRMRATAAGCGAHPNAPGCR